MTHENVYNSNGKINNKTNVESCGVKKRYKVQRDKSNKKMK